MTNIVCKQCGRHEPNGIKRKTSTGYMAYFCDNHCYLVYLLKERKELLSRLSWLGNKIDEIVDG